VRPTLEGPRTAVVRGDRILTFTPHAGEEWVEAWPIEGGEPTLLLRVKAGELGPGPGDVDAAGSRLFYWRDGAVYARSLAAPRSPEQLVMRYPRPVEELVLHPDGRRIGLRVSAKLELVDPQSGCSAGSFEARTFRFDRGGSWLAGKWNAAGQRLTRLWDLRGPSGAEPVTILGREDGRALETSFSPDSRWLVTADIAGVRFWPLARAYGHRFRAYPGGFEGLAFTPDGERLVSATQNGGVRVWQLAGEPAEQGRSLAQVARGPFTRAAPGPQGRRVLVGGRGGAFILPLDGGAGRPLVGFDPRTWVIPIAFEPRGRLAAAAALRGARADKVIRVWDLLSSELLHTLGPLASADEGGFVGGFRDLQFVSERELLSVSTEGLHLWNLERETRETLMSGRWSEPAMAASADGRHVLVFAHPDEGEAGRAQLVHLDRATGESRPLLAYGSDVIKVAVDAAGSVVVTGGHDGVVRVGPVQGGEPHLLYVEGGAVRTVAITPDGRRIAAGSMDGSIHVWSAPERSRTPFHALPREELLRALRSLTNLRAVESPESASGYRLEAGPFPGWESVPTW
jgi:WD40 repeat protein